MARIVASILSALLLALSGCDATTYVRRDAEVPDAGPDADEEEDSSTDEPAPATPVEAVFDLDGAAFFDLPFPSDLKRTEDGFIDLTGFPGGNREVIGRYITAMREGLSGYGTSSPAYFRFTRSVDETTLPDLPSETLDEDASVFLIDVDPDSPRRGERHAAALHYNDVATLYWPDHTLAVRPVYGVPLEPGVRYAAVVTRAVESTGGAFERSDDLDLVLGEGDDEDFVAARTLYGDAADVIEESGVGRDRILSLAVFTTQETTSELEQIRDWIHEEYPVPTVQGDLEMTGDEDSFVRVEGHYGPSPIFERGEPPYLEGGGEIVIEGGVPVVDREIHPRFLLTIPKSEMPEEGYPVVLYAHGTGGDYESVLGRNTADLLAELGIAAIGVDQIHHGERNPTATMSELLVFNFLNPQSIRNVFRQSALDVVQEARLVEGLSVPGELVSRDEDVHFDASHVFFYGHSQGGLNGPIFLAIDDSVSAAMLSGAGGTLSLSLVDKTEPAAVPIAVKIFLGLPGADPAEAMATESFVHEHPVAAMFQTWLEAGDPVNYAHRFFVDPRPGFAPKSVLQTEGLDDAYAPPSTIESLAGAAQMPIVAPEQRPIDALVVRDIATVDEAMGNVGDGDATAGVLQFAGEGHFLAFDNERALDAVREFFSSALEGTPHIPRAE